MYHIREHPDRQKSCPDGKINSGRNQQYDNQRYPQTASSRKRDLNQVSPQKRIHLFDQCYYHVLFFLSPIHPIVIVNLFFDVLFRLIILPVKQAFLQQFKQAKHVFYYSCFFTLCKEKFRIFRPEFSFYISCRHFTILLHPARWNISIRKIQLIP